MPSPLLEERIDHLYQLPLAEFTAARNALAREAGPDAAAVKSLQKPPVAAWAVNQLYWRNRDMYDALVRAARDQRAAHAAVLAGKRKDLREAGREHEEALEAAIKATLQLLEEDGQPATDATRQAIINTLRALPSDDPPGRLTRTLQPGGFEVLTGLPVRGRPPARVEPLEGTRQPAREAAPASARPKKSKAAVDPKALSRARDAVAAAARTLKSAEHAARREEFEAARTAREADKAQRAVEEARRALEEAQEALSEAEDAAAAAALRRDNAARRAREAEDALKKAREQARAAEDELERVREGR